MEIEIEKNVTIIVGVRGVILKETDENINTYSQCEIQKFALCRTAYFFRRELSI